MGDLIAMVWGDLGSMRFPMSFSLIVALVLTLWSIMELSGPNAVRDVRTKAWVDGILFWRGFAAISGVLGSLIAIIVTFQKIERAGAVEATIVAGGLKVGLLSTSLGLLILGITALAWFGLQLRWRLLQTAS